HAVCRLVLWQRMKYGRGPCANPLAPVQEATPNQSVRLPPLFEIRPDRSEGEGSIKRTFLVSEARQIVPHFPSPRCDRPKIFGELLLVFVAAFGLRLAKRLFSGFGK